MSAAPVNFATGLTIEVAPDLGHGLKVAGGPDSAQAADAVADESSAPKRHRRRGAILEHAIHTAVFNELAEVGYAAFTIESVANRARTGKASIYRRWPTKQDLVLDAFCGKFGETMQLVEGSLDDSTTTRDVMLSVGRRTVEAASASGEAFRAAACEISRDASLSAALEEQVNCPKRELMLGLLKRGVERGEVRPEAACELFAEVLPAMVMFRLILQNRDVDDADLTRIVDEVVMPLLRPA